MTRIPLLPALVALAVAGCGKAPDTGNAAAATAVAVGGDVEIQPGLWSATVSAPTGKRTVETCVTAADVRDARFIQGDLDGESCRVASRRVSGGTIAIDMTCGSGAEATRMRFAGSYTPTTYALDTTMTMGGAEYRTSAEARRIAPVCR